MPVRSGKVPDSSLLDKSLKTNTKNKSEFGTLSKQIIQAHRFLRTYKSVTLVRLLMFEGIDPVNLFQSSRLITTNFINKQVIDAYNFIFLRVSGKPDKILTKPPSISLNLLLAGYCLRTDCYPKAYKQNNYVGYWIWIV